MCKKILERLPAEVREPITAADVINPDVGAVKRQRATRALAALAKHYGVDIAQPLPWPADVWAGLFFSLAADFLPAFRWRGTRTKQSVGRPRNAGIDEARGRFLAARRKVKIKSDAAACVWLARRWKEHPDENPFDRLLRPASLRDHLAEAKKAEHEALVAVVMGGKPFMLGLLSEALIGEKRRRRKNAKPPPPARSGGPLAEK